MAFSRRPPAFLKVTVNSNQHHRKSTASETSASGSACLSVLLAAFPPGSISIALSPFLTRWVVLTKPMPTCVPSTLSEFLPPPDPLSMRRFQYSRMRPLLTQIQERGGVKTHPPWESIRNMGHVPWEPILWETQSIIWFGPDCLLLPCLARRRHDSLGGC